MRPRKQAIVVGTGAGGAAAAQELQRAFAVTILEAGKAFRPFGWNPGLIEKLKKTGLFLDEREIQLLFPAMRIHKTAERMILVNGIGLGGTTTLATGNGIRCDGALKALGIDLTPEFAALEREIPISTAHQNSWRPATRRLFDICSEMGLDPTPLPKMGVYSQCFHCGRCVFGCPHGVKWDSRRLLAAAIEKGAELKTGCRVERVVIEKGQAVGVQYRRGWRRETRQADLVVLAAGGLGTPVILENSGIACEPRLFVDPVLCVAGRWPGALQNKEIEMPFVVQRPGYILSPYFDYLSFFFNRSWRYPAKDTLAMMIKLADSEEGAVSAAGIDKRLTTQDRARLQEGVQLCREMLQRFGVAEAEIILGTLNAGHPGGMLPLTADAAATLHPSRLPQNLYVADATLFPRSLGNPPILTIMALARRVSAQCLAQQAGPV
ncbi:MAG TPA: FAD-dependent oxidoreductase [bacterium]|nr:FAD-dependent oxidoreductase [bacterium]HQG44248.1 FAD-dependent oxidoreductase [bacterium]HQI49224.1 FAD-dependent oxidoreductase [bacterium]HQJ63737.1 FAD-dependent oxidoreductase [bacterium]